MFIISEKKINSYSRFNFKITKLKLEKIKQLFKELGKRNFIRINILFIFLFFLIKTPAD